MRGTGQPLCSQTRTATCCSTCAALELWLLLQLNSLLRVPYVRMHFRPSDQASWVVASHKARFSGRRASRTWLLPPLCKFASRSPSRRRPTAVPGRRLREVSEDALCSPTASRSAKSGTWRRRRRSGPRGDGGNRRRQRRRQRWSQHQWRHWVVRRREQVVGLRQTLSMQVAPWPMRSMCLRERSWRTTTFATPCAGRIARLRPPRYAHGRSARMTTTSTRRASLSVHAR